EHVRAPERARLREVRSCARWREGPETLNRLGLCAPVRPGRHVLFLPVSQKLRDLSDRELGWFSRSWSVSLQPSGPRDGAARRPGAERLRRYGAESCLGQRRTEGGDAGTTRPTP